MASKGASALWHGLTGGDLAWGLLVPFLLLPVLRPRWLIMSAPIFLQHLLSWRQSEWSMHYHYAAPLLPLPQPAESRQRRPEKRRFL